MKLLNIQINGLTNPIGFQLDRLFISYELPQPVVSQIATRMIISTEADFTAIIYDSGKVNDQVACQFDIEIPLAPRTRYFVMITAWADNEEPLIGETWFETGKRMEPWSATWITPRDAALSHPKMFRSFHLKPAVKAARLYCCGLGLYEALINDQKVGTEFLAPGYNDYNHWLQVQTYEVTELLSEQNTLSFILGEGWYKGNFGFGGGKSNNYGDKYQLIAELHVCYQDGTSEVIVSDADWCCTTSPITASGIYYGETRNDQLASSESGAVEVLPDRKELLCDRLSPGVVIKETVEPIEILVNDIGEVIFDLGQNMVGWLAFKNTFATGQQIKLEYGEILQNGHFYRDNLRFAEAQFTYISGGKEEWIRPAFTYYGFRYVRISGVAIEEIQLPHFVGEVVYSDLKTTGTITTGNEQLNRLFLNTLWSQKGNFVDIPTDCPQRDERMGWTGDVQVFSPTACYNMDTQAFFTKYLQDLTFEQGENGAISMTIPNMDQNEPQEASAVWGDVCTILPWNVYRFYGDQNILASQLTSMKKWVAYIQDHSEDYLWNEGFQFGDWLALDGKSSQSPLGGTEETLIASVYSYLSTKIVADSLRVLGNDESLSYRSLAQKIKTAIQAEYLSTNGRLVVNTQTAYALILYFDLFEEKQRAVLLKHFKELLRENDYRLKTGFVGTPILCLALSKYGEDELAYTLLLNEDCPSWLYQVNMGATTIWERWNSVLPDGSMNPEGMNSLNHYAYGSIVQWMYEYMLGLQQLEDTAGFTKVKIQPKVYWRLGSAAGSYHSRAGKYMVSWEIDEDDIVHLQVTVPPTAQAKIVIEDTSVNFFKDFAAEQVAANVELSVGPGNYEFRYRLFSEIQRPSCKKTLKENYSIPVSYQLINKYLPKYKMLKPYRQEMIDHLPLGELANQTILRFDQAEYQKLIQELQELSAEKQLVPVNEQ